MLDGLRSFLIDVINSTYLLILDVAKSLSFMDNPGTYIVIMVIGFIFVPFSTKSLYHQYANPHVYEHSHLVTRAVKHLGMISAIILFGYANFLRFL